MNTTIPTDWPQISWKAFCAFLSDCPNYRREAYDNLELYRFTLSDELFAYDVKKTVYIRPDLLQPVPPVQSWHDTHVLKAQEEDRKYWDK